MTFPIIRLEVQQMQHAIKVALSEYMCKYDSDIQAEIDRVCTPENVKTIVRAEAKIHIESEIKKAISEFYRYGKGQEAIRSAVDKTLKNMNDLTNAQWEKEVFEPLIKDE